MKHIKYTLFSLFLSALIMPAASANIVSKEVVMPDYSPIANEETGTINPKWEIYNSLTEEEKINWAAVPEKYIIEYNPDNSADYYSAKAKYAKIPYAMASPASYDLRNVSGKNYVSPVKNQGNLGICWAFASNASLESNMLMNGQSTSSNPVVFSERQLDYASTKATNNKTLNKNQNLQIYNEGYNPYNMGRNIGDGGTFNHAAYFYSMGLSPVGMTGKWATWNESFTAVSLSDVFNLTNNKYLVTDFIEFPYIDNRTATATSKTTWRNKVKAHIMSYGAVYISTLSPQKSSSAACFVPGSGSEYGLINWNSSCETGTATATYNGTHAMAIIGWNDNYTNSYCAYTNGNTTTGITSAACTSGGGKFYQVTGAWILKNSWGSATQYAYLAYDSDYIEAAGIKKVVNKDYDNSYNSYGPIYVWNLDGYAVQYLYYKPRPTETLKRVSFQTATTEEVTYSVYYGDYSSSTVYLIDTITVDTPGRYSVDANDVALDQEDFVIYIVPSVGNLNTKATKVYAFTKNSQTAASATTTLEQTSLTKLSNGTYQASIATRTINVATGTKLTYRLKDANGKIITEYTDNKSYVVAGAHVGTMIIPTALTSNSVYTIETYVNGTVIGINSFATGIPLTKTTVSGKSVYNIKTESDLKYLTTLEYKFSNYQLANDITLTSSNFAPLGRYTADQFRGSLNGNNHSISNLNQNNTSGGLFYKIEATISNLKLLNVNITATGNNSGVLASSSYRSNIQNVLTEGTLNSTSANAYIGGLIGYADDTDITGAVNETSLSGGKAGAITGFLGNYTTITDALNQGLISGNKAALSTFFHSSSLTGNKITNMVDVATENSPTCPSSLPSYTTTQLTVKNVLYYDGNTCNYIGTKKTLANLKASSTYSSFGSSWTITNGKLPVIKNNPVVYITSFTPTGAKNLFVSLSSKMDISTTPTNATYKGVSLKSDNESIVKVVNGNQLLGVAPGKTTVTVTTGDGSYLTQKVPVYVFDNELKKRYDNGYLILAEGTKQNSLVKSGLNLTVSSTTIGTGTKITYKLDNQEVGSFTAVIRGDLSGDGQIQANDILLMKRHILELDKASPLNASQLKAGDINGDGVTSMGILVVRRHILGLDGGGEL